MNRNKLILVVLGLIIVLGIFGYFVYVRSDKGSVDSSKDNVSQGDKNAESGIAQKDANAELVVSLDLVDELMSKRKKLGHATYGITITQSEGGEASSSHDATIVWDDYNNYGELLGSGSFMGVSKGLIYVKKDGVAKFKGSLADENGGLLLSLVMRNYIFDNLLLEVKNGTGSGRLLGEETIDGKKYHIFESTITSGEIFKEEITRKFWVDAEKGVVLKEEIEDKINDVTYKDSDGKTKTDKGYTMYTKVAIKSAVFSEDKELIDAVSLPQDRFLDSDRDGLIDDVEKNIFKTDPNNPDTDGDGHKDGDEVDAGYDPNIKSPADKLLG